MNEEGWSDLGRAGSPVQLQTGESGQVAEKVHRAHFGVVHVHPQVFQVLQSGNLTPQVLARDVRACTTRVAIWKDVEAPAFGDPRRPCLLFCSSFPGLLGVYKRANALWIEILINKSNRLLIEMNNVYHHGIETGSTCSLDFQRGMKHLRDPCCTGAGEAEGGGVPGSTP